MLTWVSDTLTEEITVTGDVVAKLFASTTGTDSDWVVKLIDVFPEPHPTRPEMGGYQMMVAGEVFRAKFRNSYRVPEPVKPAVTPCTIHSRPEPPLPEGVPIMAGAERLVPAIVAIRRSSCPTSSARPMTSAATQGSPVAKPLTWYCR
jgi:hypothetical protein